MSDLLQWPFVRKQYPAINNPRFVGDVVAANQATLTALAKLAGLDPNTDFAIFQGLQYVQGPPANQFTPGIFYLNGTFYYMPVQFNEGASVYLTPNPVDTLSEVFQDAVARNIYTLQQAMTSATSTGNTPAFLGNMNAYRLDNKTLAADIATLQLATTPLIQTGLTLGATETLTFLQDAMRYYSTSSVNCVVYLSALNAVPGTVVRMQWTFGAGLTLAVTAGSGQTIRRDNGSLGLVASNSNTMYVMYCGKNTAGNDEWSYSINQTQYP